MRVCPHLFRGLISSILPQHDGGMRKDLRFAIYDCIWLVVGSGDISPERSEPRKRSQEGCALAVVHGMGEGRACRDRHEWAAGGNRFRASVAPSPFLLERELDPPVAIYPPSEVSRASGRNKCDPPVRMAAISSKSPCQVREANA